MNMDTLPIGTILRGKSYSYQILEKLGQGSFGITYLASVKMAGALGAIDANIKVAIKEFFMRDINGRSDATVTSGSKVGIYDDYKRKFTREAINLSKLQHPNIIKVIESFEANNTVYYVMEYIGGGSLDDYISKENGLKEDDVIKIIKQIGSALAFMHSNKMLHLDLKPSNIMMKESGDIVLIDFGLSKQYDSKGEPESSTKVGAGTPGYAPIEQANYREGKGFPVTMDVYALGATMFKMLTGVRPPEASDILNDGFPLYEFQERHISERISASIAKAMAPTKKDRYESVKAFLKSFDEEVTVIDADVVTDRSSQKTKKAENVFHVRLNTRRVTFEFHPRTPMIQGSYFCSVDKIQGVNPNITKELTSALPILSTNDYRDFLNQLQSLNLKVRDKEVPPYGKYEYSESPAKLIITFYDEDNKVYNTLWISGWNNELGNIEGNIYEIEEKIREIVPGLQKYIDSPNYEVPDFVIQSDNKIKATTPLKNTSKGLKGQRMGAGKKVWIITAISLCSILLYLLWVKTDNIEIGSLPQADTIAKVEESSLTPNHAVESSLTSSYKEVKIGDYFYSDGSTSTVRDHSKNCIGMVFSLNPTEVEKKEGWIHGHIVALEDVGKGQKYKWGPTNDLGSPHKNIEYDNKDLCSDRDGYIYTYKGLTNDGYPAFDAVRNYVAPLPQNTSGWYMPSAGQWVDILKNIGNMKGFINKNYPYFDRKNILINLKKINIIGGTYMTSSERDATMIHIIEFDNDPAGFFAPYPDKTSKFKIRAVAAF